jgi:hypothetical protein
MIMRIECLAIMIVAALSLVGCGEQRGEYIAASSISRNGFARDAEAMRKLDGQEVSIWGYVDQGNIYGNEQAREILGDWWSGDGPTATSWRFNLKANPDDAVGRSFEVRVPNDEARDEFLRRFVADANARRPTRVFLTGTIITVDVPTTNATLTGLVLKLQSSDDMLLELPDER